MTLRNNEIITSLAHAIEWSTSAMWSSKFESETMHEMALKNIESALDNIADAQAELKKMRKELQNR
jgi:hypothetical protein